MQPKIYTAQYHANFIKMMKIIMANEGMNTIQEAADWLAINRVSLLQIMGGKQAPTVEQGITLCLKGKISANWLFLSKGPQGYDDVVTLKNIEKQLVKLVG